MGRFWRQVQNWERAERLAFGIALLLLLIVGGVLLWGPSGLRQPALIGLLGLVIVGQVIVMWANRDMVTAFTKAQRLYLDEDFAGVCQLLEAVRERGKADDRLLTLLGNAYRQLGSLAKSEEVLTEALTNQPSHYFPLYGFGRTLLVQGRYAEAAQMIEKALSAGAPRVVQMDAAEAYYRNNQPEFACEMIVTVLEDVQEPYRQLMGVYLLCRLNQGPPPSVDLILNGLSYWQAQAERYSQTPYGQTLAQDVYMMQSMMKET